MWYVNGQQNAPYSELYMLFHHDSAGTVILKDFSGAFYTKKLSHVTVAKK